MNSVSQSLGQHYARTFAEHGPSSAGVDWGPDESKMLLRYEKMLAVGSFDGGGTASLLDVGCGYGGLKDYAASLGVNLAYTGIDVAGNMIEWARANAASAHFIHGDILEHAFETRFDYIVCNGILTQKLDTEALKMDAYAAQLIRRMFDLCNVGVAFNVMTTRVNFYANNLYYRNPAEMLAWCQLEVTPHVKLDHAYPLYEYTVYLYRHPVRTTPRMIDSPLH